MPHPGHLADLLHQLRTISQSLPVLESQGYNPPIIDGDDGYAHNGDPIIGLRIFKDAVGREVDVLEQYLARSSADRGSDISTNAPYFVAVWNEIVSAPPPIVAVGKIFEPPNGRKRKAVPTGSAKPGRVKVDVVADEGRQWIRVNTMKNSRLWAEFREMDSYFASDDEPDNTDEPSPRPTTDRDTSLLRMGRALAAASAAPIAGTHARPRVTLRLTRLQPHSADGARDARIAETMDALTGMGLDVQLGERAFRGLYHRDGEALGLCHPCRSPARLYPSERINMDLSMLIALVSDLSHAELPDGEDGAWARFWMPVNGRAGTLRGDGAATASEEDGERSQHSRALSMQCLREMKHGLIDEVVGRLRSGPIEFWTTEEARDRCLQIVEQMGGEDEKRRARALFPAHPATDLSRCREEFWRGSRYAQSYFTALLPMHIHAPHAADGGRCAGTEALLFWGHLVQTCRHVLSHDAAPHAKTARAQVTRANPKLTVHTVQSMLAGACEGMTTLTANRASVRALLREMKGVKYGCEDATTAAACCGGVAAAAAAVWIVEPRSLAEGMRADR